VVLRFSTLDRQNDFSGTEGYRESPDTGVDTGIERGDVFGIEERHRQADTNLPWTIDYKVSEWHGGYWHCSFLCDALNIP
jgi:hypothetical protein